MARTRKVSAKSMKKRAVAGALHPGTTFADVQDCVEKGEQNMVEQAQKALAKVYCRKKYEGTAFFYSKSGYLLTARHVIWDDEKNQYRKSLTIQPYLGGQISVKVVADFNIDVAILKADYECGDFLRAANMKMGSTGYIMGFRNDSAAPRVSKGLISTDRFPNVQAYIAAHADHGYSGGPIIDHQGKVQGLVTGGDGEAMLTTRFMPCGYIALTITNWSGQTPVQNVPNLIDDR